MGLKTALSGIQHQQEVCHLIEGFNANQGLASYCVCLPQSLCCFPRLRASGLGRSSLHLGPAVIASHSGACVQTEAELPFKQAYVILNKHTRTYSHVHAA